MFKRRHASILPFASLLFLSACVSIETPARLSAVSCENEMASLKADYPGAAIAACKINSDAAFSLVISPENTPINDSPWYGFQLTPKQNGDVSITLNYKDGTHRYPPKASYDGKTWTALAPKPTMAQKSATHEFSLQLRKGAPVFISAQENLGVDWHEASIDNTAALPFVERSVAGRSVKGHPIYKLEASSRPDNPVVLFVGRQHPPEITGAIAMDAFMDEVFGPSELAQSFRAQYNIVSLPLLNPDGVKAGYWRHNKNGIDLNRDWGPFEQPETRAIKSILDNIDANERKIALFVDFHSTWRNLFYTQVDGKEVTVPENFTREWLSRSDAAIDDEVYGFTREESPVQSGKFTSKNYIYTEYGVPAITYEVGDHSDREATKQAAKVFAKEMMKLMLKESAAYGHRRKG